MRSLSNIQLYVSIKPWDHHPISVWTQLIHWLSKQLARMNKGFEHFAGHYRHESIKEFDIWLSGDHVGWFTNHDPPTTCLCILCNNKEHKFPLRPSITCVTSLNRSSKACGVFGMESYHFVARPMFVPLVVDMGNVHKSLKMSISHIFQ
jgi:hypothetical protein